MRTDLSLPYRGGGVSVQGGVSVWGSLSREGSLSKERVYVQGGSLSRKPPWTYTPSHPVGRMTHASKNITLLQTSFPGGKYESVKYSAHLLFLFIIAGGNLMLKH